jgi:hypothetical protein
VFNIINALELVLLTAVMEDTVVSQETIGMRKMQRSVKKLLQ